MSDYKYVCKKCGSDQVEQKAWVDLSTTIVLSWCSDGDIEDNWCRECLEHCEIELVLKK